MSFPVVSKETTSKSASMSNMQCLKAEIWSYPVSGMSVVVEIRGYMHEACNAEHSGNDLLRLALEDALRRVEGAAPVYPHHAVAAIANTERSGACPQRSEDSRRGAPRRQSPPSNTGMNYQGGGVGR